MNLWRRLKNLWELSMYTTISSEADRDERVLVKDFPTIKKQLAKIIPNEEKTIYEILES